MNSEDLTQLLDRYRRTQTAGIGTVGRPGWGRPCRHRPGRLIVNEWTGELSPARCERQNCPDCLPVLVWSTGLAICLARPRQFLTLTAVAEDWPSIRRQTAYFAKCLRRAEAKFEWAYHVERNPLETGNHLHAWIRGNLRRELVAAAAVQAGMGPRIDLENRPLEEMRALDRHGQLKSLDYGMKALRGGTGDGADESVAAPTGGSGVLSDQPSAQAAYLVLNGHRLVHSSRGFWLNRHGRPTTLRKARRDAAALKRHDQPLRFSGVPSRRPRDTRPKTRD
jgi:hypothetical protein